MKKVQLTPKQMQVVSAIQAGLKTVQDIHIQTAMTYNQVYTILKTLTKLKYVNILERKYYSLPVGLAYSCLVETKEGTIEKSVQTVSMQEHPLKFQSKLQITKITPEEYDEMYAKAMAKHRLFVNKNGTMFINPHYKGNEAKQ